MPVRRVLKRLLKARKSSRLHFTLIDPEKTDEKRAYTLAKAARDAGTDAILVGGSLGVSEPNLTRVVVACKKVGLPVILFPGNINGLTPKADAVLFLYLMNSDDPYFIVGAQVQAAPIILKMGLETIPTAYIIVGYGGTAGYVGRARPIPYDKPELVASYALAAAMMGAKAIYLEAGSGAPKPVPVEAIRLSKKMLEAYGSDALLIVGGGVKDSDYARKLAEAGADVLVTGTIVEEDPGKLASIISAFKS